jgi:hypothetical protein
MIPSSIEVINLNKKKMKIFFIIFLISSCLGLKWRLENESNWKEIRSYPYLGNIDESFSFVNYIKPISDLNNLDECKEINSSIKVNATNFIIFNFYF